MKELTVYKLDENGRQVYRYPAEELERQNNYVRLNSYFDRDDLDLGFAIFAYGDRFVEYFYNDRWYNIFVVHEGDSDTLKGWYCNVCRPALLGESEIRCEDLALDVWAGVDGSLLVLDEDEFAALSLTAEESANCRAALEQLLRLAEDGDLPR